RRRRLDLPAPGPPRRRGVSPARRAGRAGVGLDGRLDARARGGGGAAARTARQDGRRARGRRARLPAPGAGRCGAAAGRGERAGEPWLRARGGRGHVGAPAGAVGRPGVFRVGGGVRACSVPDAPCSEPANGIVAAAGQTLWLVGGRARKTLKASRVVLAPGAARQVQLELDGERPAQLDVANPTGDAVLVVATSLAGQPGVVLAAPGASASPRAAGQAMAVGPHSAVSVALSGKRPTAVVWTA